MKMNSLPVLCLSILLFYIDFSFGKRIGGGFGKSFGSKKPSTSNRGSHTNTGHKSNQGSSSQGGYPKQPGQSSQGGYPPQSGRPGYPAQGSPYGGYGNQGGYGRYGGYGGYGGYPGGSLNQNPNNKVLSPHYGGSFGYGGYGTRGGSPFSQSVQAMGMYPSDKSRGFGRNALLAAGGGAVAGMALGYGLGRFPRPHFHFQSPQEEYYYNHYMYRKYGVKSTDTNDYSRDYKYISPPPTYDSHMDSCMKRTDILPAGKQKPNEKSAAVTSALDTGSNTTETNSSRAENSSAAATPRPVKPETSPFAPASQAVSDAEDDDTVSIVEIGYPALIEQLKARRCLELYMIDSERHLKREAGGAQGLGMSLQGLLAVVTSTLLMLLNSNMLTLPN